MTIKRRRRKLNWAGLGLDLITLRIFVAAVEERSYVRAAERENIAVSAVSRRIAYMEDRLGTPLLRRHDRGIEPTAAGQVLLNHVRVLFNVLDRAIVDVDAFAAGVRGRIRLHAALSAVAGFLPDSLASFMQDNPGIEVTLEEHLSVDILRNVQIGVADVGLLSGTVEDPYLELMPCRTDRLVVLLPVGHRLAAERGPLLFSELLDEPFVGLSSAMALQNLYRRKAAALGGKLRELANVSSFDSVRRMVEVGLGVAILPEAGAQPYPGQTRIVIRQLDEPWAERPLAICVRETQTLSSAARMLIAHLLGREEF
jgi:DNA-binding transcriptional LysR family regulator